MIKSIELAKETIDPKTGAVASFLSNDICRYQVKFPMDATYGDFLAIRFEYLDFVEVTVGLGTVFEYSTSSKHKFNQFLFTKK